MGRLTAPQIALLVRKPDAELVKRLPCGKCVPIINSIIKGGIRTGTEAEAAEDTRINLLTRLKDTDPIFQSGVAKRLKKDVKDRRRRHPLSRQTGAHACIVPGMRPAYRVAGHTVRAVAVAQSRVSDVRVNEAALNASDGDLTDYLRAFADDAQAVGAPSTKHYLDEQWEASVRIQHERARAYAQGRARDARRRRARRQSRLSASRG